MTHFRNSKNFFENITHMRHFLSYFSYCYGKNQIDLKINISGAKQEYYYLLLYHVFTMKYQLLDSFLAHLPY